MRKLIPPLILIAAVIASVVVYGNLPASMPTHWNADGDVNGWSSRAFGAFLIPVMIAFFWLLMRFVPRIDPRGENFEKFGGAFDGIIIAVMLFLFGVHVVVLRAALGHHIDMQRVVPIGIGALFAVIGAFLPQAQPNWFVGIRTPWTLSSDVVWQKTHRLGGKLFVGSGLLMILSALVAPSVTHITMFALIAITVGFLFVYSFLEWRREGSPKHPASAAGISGGAPHRGGD
jgi:uncharacterized membrane protein